MSPIAVNKFYQSTRRRIKLKQNNNNSTQETNGFPIESRLSPAEQQILINGKVSTKSLKRVKHNHQLNVKNTPIKVNMKTLYDYYSPTEGDKENICHKSDDKTNKNSDTSFVIKNQLNITPIKLVINNNIKDGDEEQETDSIPTFSTQEMRQRVSIFDENTPIGLKNLVNTCYMNAIIQSLFVLRFFITDLENKYKELNSEKDLEMTRIVLNVYKQYNQMRDKSDDCQQLLNESLLSLKSCVGKRSHTFLSHLQQDAAEFFTHIIDIIAEEFDEMKNLDPIEHNFTFETLGSLTCKTCHNKTEMQNEKFQTLYLTIPDNHSLETAFKEYLKDETTRHKCIAKDCLANENVLEKCFAKLSKVLFIQLGRYDEDGDKRNEQVMVPQFIRLPLHHSNNNLITPSPLSTPYKSKFHLISNNSKVVRNLFNENQDKSLDNKTDTDLQTGDYVIYQLVAVICHHGISLSVGHYTCFVYNNQNNQWFECDDNDIYLSDFDFVQNKSQETGYCYIYVIS
ncbi:putative ubiquitin carboxyl-terminal hydrolase 50 [Oppia nitens]|uniref:putative ubiquitin carboxyl-terminal hydrolase 50 n=1 Tax=Oppia nitens TaxID=1686743 RepID=UPI0023D9935D|nr:putative ubiquitin carboxyl-terminal hydrolase 50 [Oppia nitens]